MAICFVCNDNQGRYTCQDCKNMICDSCLTKKGYQGEITHFEGGIGRSPVLRLCPDCGKNIFNNALSSQ